MGVQLDRNCILIITDDSNDVVGIICPSMNSVLPTCPTGSAVTEK